MDDNPQVCFRKVVARRRGGEKIVLIYLNPASILIGNFWMNNEREDHLITRRRMLTLMGGSLMMASAGCSDEEVPIDETGPCPPTPENEEGRHFVEHENVRSDLLEGESGVALELWIKIVTARTCA